MGRSEYSRQVVIGDKLPPSVLQSLEVRFDVIHATDDHSLSQLDLCPARVLVVGGPNRVDPDLLQRMPALELLAVLGSGYEGVDLKLARARNIKVTHAGGVTAGDVSDYAVGLMIALVRGVVSGDAFIRANSWPTSTRAYHRSLAGMKMGIAGFGAIGSALAARLQAFGCQIAWTGRRERRDVEFTRYSDVGALAAASDVLFVTLRADATNFDIIDAAVLDQLGPTGYLINVSRGTAVEEGALIKALQSGRLGGAALDVFKEEPTAGDKWLDVPNLILSPHQAGMTDENIECVNQRLIENLERFFGGQVLLDEVGYGR